MRKKKATPPRGAAAAATCKVDYALADRLLPLEAVIQITGIGKTTIYRLQRAGAFPQSCKPGGAATRWSEREVLAWKEAQLAARVAA